MRDSDSPDYGFLWFAPLLTIIGLGVTLFGA